MNTIRKQAQAGFTLIELIVVIVILGILAATALPRMFDMSGQARLAKMQAGLGAVKASAATAHAAWLMNGGVLGCATCSASSGVVPASTVTAEGQTIATIGGYPDVGGDGHVNATATAVTELTSGIYVAANLAADYVITSKDAAGAFTNNTMTFSADAGHPLCRFTYTEASQNTSTTANTPSTPIASGVRAAPQYNVANLTLGNCG